jgi:predicted AlkP superfamily pyrophosphatase or phosphodiesterase
MSKYSMRKLNFLLFSVLSLLSACTTPSSDQTSLHLREDPKPLVLLISIDGFKPEYLNRGITPHLNHLAKTGSIARGLIPSFPSITFPNHYSIVTGLYPDHHGIVNNLMKDPSIAEPFKLSSRSAVENPQWWSAGVPIWVSAQQQGLKTSTMFWPGSEAKIQGIQPNDWLSYDKTISSDARVTQLTQWLNRPAIDRADFATLYFEEVDSNGHRFGPDSQEVNNAVSHVDSAIGKLVENLEHLGLMSLTTIIIVSDHGMAFVPSSNRIDLKDLLGKFHNATVEWQGPLAGINLHGNSEQRVLSELQKNTQMNCWPKNKMPAKYHFGTHSRIPDVICLAELHWTINEGPSAYQIPGQHGFDPELPDMHGILIASGHGVAKKELGLVENIEVYPFIIHLLGIEPAKNDAKDVLFEYLRQP